MIEVMREDQFSSISYHTFVPQWPFRVYWVTLRIMPKKSRHVFVNCGIVFGSGINDPDTAMLTIGHPIRCAIGVLYVIDVYGLQTEHVTDHILSHLWTVVHSEGELIHLDVFSEDSQTIFLKEIITGLGLEPYDYAQKEMYCLEQLLK